jgi:hypothetical protein
MGDLADRMEKSAQDYAAKRAVPRNLPDVSAYRPGMIIPCDSPEEGEQLVKMLKERGSRYGSFVGHAAITQELKRVVAVQLLKRNKQLRPSQQEALDMIMHKIGRIINGDADYDDSWQDIAGYAQLEVDRIHGKLS